MATRLSSGPQSGPTDWDHLYFPSHGHTWFGFLQSLGSGPGRVDLGTNWEDGMWITALVAFVPNPSAWVIYQHVAVFFSKSCSEIAFLKEMLRWVEKMEIRGRTFVLSLGKNGFGISFKKEVKLLSRHSRRAFGWMAESREIKREIQNKYITFLSNTWCIWMRSMLSGIEKSRSELEFEGIKIGFSHFFLSCGWAVLGEAVFVEMVGLFPCLPMSSVATWKRSFDSAFVNFHHENSICFRSHRAVFVRRECSATL